MFTKKIHYISVDAPLIDIFHKARISNKVLNYTLEVISGKFISFYNFDLRLEVSVLFNKLNSNLLQVHVIPFVNIEVKPKQESLLKLLTSCQSIICQYFNIVPLNVV